MTIRAYTNNPSLISQNYFSRNLASLSDSIEKLSSGLRINKTADDPATAIISDQLNAQALGLGQAVKNANDAMSITQIVDGSLDESIDIVNSIKSKATQAASDSATTDDRDTLQADINKLLEELNLVVETSTYNGQSLLNGNFTSKEFQVGTESGQVITANLGSAQGNRVGYLGTGQLSLTTEGGDVSLSIINPILDQTLSITGLTMAYDNSADHGLGAVADAINKYTDQTDISAQAVVESTSSGSVQAGVTSAAFAINGVNIGAVTVQADDSDGSLITAINAKTASHGITASITSGGQLQLTSNDNRAILVSGLDAVLPSENLSTFGYVQIYQQGAQQLNLTDLSQGMAVSFSSNLKMAGDVTTTIDSNLAYGSVLGGGSTLQAGWQAGMTITGADLSGSIVTSTDSTLLAGSVLASGSTIAAGSVLGGTAYNEATINSTYDNLLQAGSTLTSGSVIHSGTYLTNDISTAGGSITAGTILSANETLNADVTLSSDMLILSGSTVASGSTLAAGSYLGGDFNLSGTMATTADTTLKSGSTIIDQDGVTQISAGSTVGGDATFTAGDLTVTQNTMFIPSGSLLSSSTELATGSTIGGTTILNGNHTATADIYLASGSILASTSLVKSGTVLTNNLVTTSGLVLSGETTEQDYQTSGSNNIDNAMTLKLGSVISSGSTLAANSQSEAGFQLNSESTLRLKDISVLNQEDASTAMAIADAALADLNRLKKEAGALQDQFLSASSVLGATKVNILNARSKMLDVDFVEEAANFSRMKILVQANAFALTQANTTPAIVLPILQGYVTGNANQFYISASAKTSL